MPIYEHECPACGRTFEIQKKLKHIDVEVYCLHCGDVPLKRLCGNAGGFRLKGRGWSEDGYATLLGDAQKFKSS